MSQTIVITQKDGESFDSWPCLARLGNGELLLTFTRRPKDRIRDSGHIVAMRSSDGGRTWSEPISTIDTPDMMDLDPSIVAWDDRVIVISTTVPSTHSERVTVSSFLAVHSEDNGRTWSELKEIPHPYTYCSGKTNAGARLDDGTIVFGFSWDARLQEGGAVYCDADQICRAGVMISSDDGRTWIPGETIGINETRAEHEAGLDGLDEPCLAVCQDGGLYMLMRSNLERLYEARSSDRGRTWSKPRPTTLVSHSAPADLAAFDHPRLGRGWLVAYNDSPVRRRPLSVAVSLDDGATWSAARPVANEQKDSHYPACVRTPDGDILVAWQQDTDGGRHIEGCLIGDDTIEQLARLE